MSLLSRCLIAVFASVVPLAGWAAYEGPMRFSVFWPCIGNAGFCAPQILAEGKIERNTAQRLVEFIADKRANRYELPPRPTIAFDSPGGNLADSIEMGRFIRSNKFETRLSLTYSKVVESPQLQEQEFVSNAKCASACTLAFLGGIRRAISPAARFGIHQFSGISGNIGDEATQVTVVALAGYVEEMGVDRAMLDAASLVPASTIRWLSSQQLRTLRIDNTTPQINPWTIKASSQGVALLYTEQEVSYGRSMSLTIAIDNGRALVLALTNLQRSVYKEDRTKQFPVTKSPELSFSIDGKAIGARPISPWSKAELADTVTFRTFVTLSLQELQMISHAKTLEISDNFGTATEDVSLTTNLSTEGLASGVALLLRAR